MKSFIKHSKGSLRVSLRGPALGPPKVRSVGQFQHYLLEWKLTVIVADCGRPEFEARGDECVVRGSDTTDGRHDLQTSDRRISIMQSCRPVCPRQFVTDTRLLHF